MATGGAVAGGRDRRLGLPVPLVAGADSGISGQVAGPRSIRPPSTRRYSPHCAPPASGTKGDAHPKTHALAVELLNNWEVIFQVLAHLELPLTNNEAERALRHWVILRKLSLGTRTPIGSRVVALLASVIDTCRQRGHVP